MTIFALIGFISAALLGVYLLSYILQDKNTPKGVALIHGFFGALGILFLALTAYLYSWLFFFFCCAALGGAILFFHDLSHKKPSKSLALAHGVIALTCIVVLFISYFFI